MSAASKDVKFRFKKYSYPVPPADKKNFNYYTGRKAMKIIMTKSFEESIKELESIVAKLENPDATLDDTLTYFEKGIKLSNSCRKMLETAEKKVSVLLANENGELEKQDFIGEE